jgi:hypothetical protein
MSTASGSSAAGGGLGTWILRVLDGEFVEVAWPPLLWVMRELEMALLRADGHGSLFRHTLKQGQKWNKIMRRKCHACMPSTQTGAHCLDFPTHLAKVRSAVQQRDCVVGVVEVAAVQLHELDEKDAEVERRRPRLVLDPRMQLAGEGVGG